MGLLRVGTGSASLGSDKQKADELEALERKSGAGHGGAGTTPGGWVRDLTQEATRGGSTIGDVMLALSTSNPMAYHGLSGEVRGREAAFRNLEQAAMMQKAGLMPNPNGGGGFIIDKMMRDPGQGKYSAGSQIEKQRAEKSPQGGGRNRWQEDRDFERGLAQNAQRNNQSLAFSQKQAQQDQAMKMKMLQQILSQFRAGSQGGGEGFTEQIFNSAGAPEVVRLRNKDGGQQQQMLMQLLSRFGG